MNNNNLLFDLPNDILIKIYQIKHKLEFKKILKQILEIADYKYNVNYKKEVELEYTRLSYLLENEEDEDLIDDLIENIEHLKFIYCYL